MFGHRSFLTLGGDAGDILNLIKEGYEIANYSFSFEQGLDDKGKAATRVFGGAIHVTLPQLPTDQLIEWAIKPRKYKNGAIVLLDEENVPVEKLYFENAACISFGIVFDQEGKSYTTTRLTIQPEKITVGNGIDFTNEWTV